MSAMPSHKGKLTTLQIGNDWPTERVGGLNRYFMDLLRHLPASGADAHGLVVGPSNIYTETHGTVTAFSPSSDPLPKRLWRARQAALEQLRTGSVDLLVSHFALYTAPLGAHASDRPMVVHFHGPWAAESHVEGSASISLRIKRRFEQGVYKQGRLFIVLSAAFGRELVRRYNVDEALLRVVPGGIDTARFNIALSRAEARDQLGWPKDRPVVLAVRRMVRRMGLENLVDAMKLVVAGTPEALLLLGGKGPLSTELTQRIEQSGLGNNVRLLGRIEEKDLPLAYRAADVSVVPSQALEGFGMITLESLASGTPVLVTPVGGLPEVVRPFDPGSVFTDISTKAIAQGLGDVLRGQQALPTQAACREYAVENFAWARIARRVSEAYSEALHLI